MDGARPMVFAARIIAASRIVGERVSVIFL